MRSNHLQATDADDGTFELMLRKQIVGCKVGVDIFDLGYGSIRSFVVTVVNI
jgi:hypothetical protein